MKRSAAWFLPPLVKDSNELRTLLLHIQGLGRAGYENVLLFDARKTEQPAALAKKLLDWYGFSGAAIHVGWEPVRTFDVAIATHWRGAHHVARLARADRRVYVMQDYEPRMFSMGGDYLLAENACRLGLATITLGRWPARKLNDAFQLAPACVDLGVDLSVFNSRKPDEEKERAVCFYYQPDKPALGPVLGLKALRLLRQVLPNHQVYLFGSELRTEVPFDHHHLGPLSPHQASELFNRCQAGLCLTTRNPVRQVFEMLASGLPVVNLHTDNNLYDLPEAAVLLAQPDPAAIKNALLQVLAGTTRRGAMAAAALAAMRSRSLDGELTAFVHAIDALFASPAPAADRRSLPPPVRYSRPAVTVHGEPSAADLAREWELITYDVWDTVLRRRCHPDEVKLFTARYFSLKYPALAGRQADAFALVKERSRCEADIGERSRQDGFDDEYTLADVLALWVGRVANRPLSPDTVSRIAAELADVELAQEKNVIYADPRFPALLDRFKGERRHFVSDFYMSAAQISDLMLAAGCAPALAQGVTSADVRLNKRSGRLFTALHDEFKLSPDGHLHLGDNDYSDVYSPCRRGASALLYYDHAEHAKNQRLHREFSARDGRADFRPDELRISSQVRPDELDELPPDQALFQLGAAGAPLLAGFALFLAEEALRLGLSRLYFFTREGEFFAKVYAELAAHNPLGIPFPEPVVVEVSRLATFAASLHRFDLREFMRLWNLYSAQSFRAFFVSLDLDPAPLAPLLQSHRLVLTEVIRQPWQDPRVIALFSDERFTRALAAHSAEKRALLLDYFKSKGLRGDEPQIGIVDIGWRGTIQDNIALALGGGTTVHGFYLGMLPLLNAQPANVTKTAFGPGRPRDSEEIKRLLDFVSPLEMLCNSEFGTTLRYERRDGAVIAQRERDAREDHVFTSFTRHFQAGVLDAVGAFARSVRTRAISSEELRPLAIESLSLIAHQPPRAVAEAYFNLNHNETFGAGVFDDKQRHQANVAAVRKLYETGELDAFEQHLVATTWPQGFARLCDVKYPFFHATPQAPAPLPAAKLRAAQELAARARTHYHRREFPQARQLALLALAINPWMLDIHHLAYRSCLALAQTKAAMLHFRLIGKLQLKHPPTLNEFACRSSAVGLDGNALTIFETIVAERPDYKPAVQNLARLHLRQGDFTSALTLLDKHKDAFKHDADHAQFTATARVIASLGLLKEAAPPPTAEEAGASTFRRLNELRAKTPADAADLEAQAVLIKAFTKPVSDDAYLS